MCSTHRLKPVGTGWWLVGRNVVSSLRRKRAPLRGNLELRLVNYTSREILSK